MTITVNDGLGVGYGGEVIKHTGGGFIPPVSDSDVFLKPIPKEIPVKPASFPVPVSVDYWNLPNAKNPITPTDSPIIPDWIAGGTGGTDSGVTTPETTTPAITTPINSMFNKTEILIGIGVFIFVFFFIIRK